MDQLIDSDYRRLLDVIYQVNATRDIKQFGKVALFCVKTFAPYSQGAFFSLKQVPHGTVTDVVVPSEGRMPLLLQKFIDGDYQSDRIFRAMSVLPTSCAFRDTDLFGEGELRESATYREVYRPAGFRWALRIELVVGSHAIGNFSLMRMQDDDNFSDRELKMCDLLARHLAQKLDSLQQGASGETDDRKGVSTASLTSRFGLTNREAQVAMLISEGCTDNQIADRLSISTSTVRKHLHTACVKAGAANRTALVRVILS